MTSRLTLTAALFAIVTTGSFAFATGVRTTEPAAMASAQPAAIKVVQLERVVISAKRVVASI